VTPLCALTCPRCRSELPEGAFYGPCAACRSGLKDRASADYERRLEHVADALAAGWSADPARRSWVRPEPCSHCAGAGRVERDQCQPCRGVGTVEVLVAWEGGR
jgi:hypothetical protein